MALDVSVVVPVFNPGVNLDACLHALLSQTLDPSRYEIVLVDDGSTDGTADRLDATAREHGERVQVIREPNSGWPGRPRNVGVDAARGDYVQFVDNDDVLAPHALERMLADARASDADIVIGKLTSDFRVVDHTIYRVDVSGVTWRDFPLVNSLTPHKMFRTELLRRHGIRFAEGRRHLEDQLYCMHAYAHARSVAVVASEPCYFYRRRRGFGRNAGDVPADPDDYYRDLEDVLDVIDAHCDDDELRTSLYARFARVEMLGRLRDRVMLDYADDYRQRVFDRVRDLLARRVPETVDAALPFLARVQARLVRSDNLDALLAFARDLDTLTVDLPPAAARWEGGLLQLPVDATLRWQGRPWQLDSAPGAGDDLRRAFADVVVVQRGDGLTWMVPPSLDVSVADGVLGVRGDVSLDPRTAAGGGALPPGLWDLRLRMHIGGMTRTVPFMVAPAAELRSCLYDGEPLSVTAYETAAGSLALDVDEWMHALTDVVASAARRASAGEWLVPSVVAATTVTRPAHVLDVGDRTTYVEATLSVTAGGAVLRAGQDLPDDAGWVRVGEPGRSAPARLTPDAS